MIISIPNFKPVFGYLLFFGMLIGIAAFSWDTLKRKEEIDTVSTVMILIFGTVSIAFIFQMSHRFKLIILDKSTIKQIRPFRFKSVLVRLEDITNLSWDVWDTHKMGVYRKMKVLGSAGQLIELTDFEFSNFDSLQERILTAVNFETNLAQKRTVEINQARTNRRINYFVIPLLAFFILLNGTYLELENQFWIRIAIILILSGIVWRLTNKIILYNYWLKKFSAVRKRRLRKLKERKER